MNWGAFFAAIGILFGMCGLIGIGYLLGEAIFRAMNGKPRVWAPLLWIGAICLALAVIVGVLA